ncbi:MAG: prepilin-type N-terminal cleavage/methylation domain-containing protein [Psychrosphaera sp.]|nr:prepilin-type N-terminal cleavage/methylation domain-containing protein [Psychrosphaera sp.]
MAAKRFTHLKPVKNHRGFTLIEMIAGIVIMAISMTALTSVLYPYAVGSTDPIFQVRAAELGQSLLNEITGKSYDENTDLNAGIRCGEAGTACTAVVALGKDAGETTASTFDDVDDYDEYDETMAQLDSSANYDTLYRNFTFTVTVNYDGNYDGIIDANMVAKRIEIAIVTPGNQTFRFAAYKANF